MTCAATSPPRRRLLAGGVAAVALVPSARALAAAPDPFAASPFRKLTDAQWKARLPGASYAVLRHEATEAPFSSPLNDEHAAGVFACLGCGLPLFKSAWKFDSGTGWPSFYTVIPGSFGRRPISPSAFRAPSTTAPAAWATRATSSTTDPGPPAFAIATTAWR